MKAILPLSVALLVATGSALAIKQPAPSLAGHYLEVRSCDVYTGSCFANAEVGVTGKEGMLVWSIEQGAWNGINLSGLSVIAVIKSDETLGDLRYQPRQGKAVIITDDKASPAQEQALIQFAQSKTGPLTKTITAIRSATIQSTLGTCAQSGCASVKAGELVEISTRCLGNGDHLCGNEETYYPPLTEITGATAAFTELAAFRGKSLNVTWESAGTRSAFIGTFDDR